MKPQFASTCLFGASLALLSVPRAEGQCTTIDFENLAVGTVVTSQYNGVTISGRDTDGTTGVNPRIYAPSGGTTSGTRCLSAQGDGIDEFSPEFLRFDFDQDQLSVTFNLGVRRGCLASDVVNVRIYSFTAPNTYTQQRNMSVPVNGTLASPRVLVFIRAERTTGLPFRRIEVEAGQGGVCAERFELIDDLSFDVDTTPPVAIIDPLPSCVCNGASILGDAYDPDASITGWVLHQRKRGNANWDLLRVSVNEVINGELGPWNNIGGDGEYTLRLQVTNECGLMTETFADVYMDRAFNALSVRSPTAGAILGGTVCVDGTVWDHCGGEFTVEHRTVGGGAWLPFESVSAPWVTTDPLASSDASSATDGNYEIRVTATDDCGNTAASPIIPVVVDNTLPTAIITSPANCAAVGGVVPITGIVNDAYLAGWSLSYSGGDAHDWVPVPGGQGAGNVNGVLANWDTTGLPPCCYALRLVATDTASVNCGSTRNQREFIVTVDVGGESDCVGDLNGDGLVDLIDLAMFLSAFGTVCP